MLQSIHRAHKSVRRGSLEFAYGELLGANINRSPTSYLKNPAEERARYEHDVDKEMTLLKVVDQDSGRCYFTPPPPPPSPSFLSAPYRAPCVIMRTMAPGARPLCLLQY